MTRRAIEEHPFLRDLTDDQVERLLSCGREFAADAGTFICREGGDADTLYLLTAGRVVMEQHVPGRGASQLESLSAGDMLGLSWLFPGKRWTLDARAADAVAGYALDAAAVRERMQEDPSLGFALLMHIVRAFYERLQRVRLQRLDVYKKAGG